MVEAQPSDAELPEASVPQENTPFVDFTSQLALLRAETVRLVLDAIPTTSSWARGVARPIPTFPFESMMKAVEVEVRVEVEMLKKLAEPFEAPAM